jgi:hypothetical protein
MFGIGLVLELSIELADQPCSENHLQRAGVSGRLIRGHEFFDRPNEEKTR